MKLFYNKGTFFFICSYKDKNIPKRNNFLYMPASKTWYTKNAKDAYNLRQFADPKLKELLENYNNKRTEIIEKSWSDNSNIEIKSPDGYSYFPFQKAGIEYAMNKKYTLIADEPGCGKTIQVCGIINTLEAPKNILIVCPNTIKYNWKSELERWIVHKDLTISVNNMTSFEHANIIIINYDAFRYNVNPKSDKFKDPKKGEFNPTYHLMKEFDKIKEIDLLVCDESHKLKNWGANTTKNIFKLKKKVKKAVFLTGTPIMGKIEELWTTIKFFEKQNVFGRNKNEFMKQWCGAQWNPYMRRYESNPDLISKDTYEKLQENLRMNFMIRRKKSQVLKDLPDKIRSIIPVEIDRSVLSDFEYLTRDVVDATRMNTDASKSILSSVKPSMIQELTELRKLTGELKVDPAFHFIKDFIESGEKVVVFGHHVSVLEKLYMKFRKNSVMIRGGTTDADRHKSVERFQNDPNINVFIGQNDTASLGITLTASSNLVIVESSWTPSVNIQIEDRINRIGTKFTSNIYYLVADRTLDAHIIQTVIKKQEVFEKVIERESIGG